MLSFPFKPLPQHFVKFDTTQDNLESLAGELGVKALPAFKFFKVRRKKTVWGSVKGGCEQSLGLVPGRGAWCQGAARLQVLQGETQEECVRDSVVEVWGMYD